MFRHALPVAILAFLATVLLSAAETPADDDRQAIPSQSAQEEALALIKSVFSQEYASTDAKHRRQLAGALLDQSRKPENDSAAQFVLLREAVTVAAEAGDVRTTMAAADATIVKFRVNSASVKSFGLATLAKSVRRQEDHRQVARACFEVIDELIVASEFAAADEILKTAESAARGSRDAKLIAEVRTNASNVRKAEADYEKVAAYARTLGEDPTDPEANLEMGKYECFSRQDWHAGLPLLALGSDEALSALAGRSIASDAEPQQQFELANDWWDLAETRPDAECKKIQAYALTIYREVAPQLSGLTKTVAEKRIREAAEAAEAADAADDKVAGRPGTRHRPRVINLLSLMDLEQDAEPRKKWAVANNVLQCVDGSFVPKVVFPYQPPEEYDVKFVFMQPSLRNGVGVICPNRNGGCFALGVSEDRGDAWFLSVDGRSPKQRVPNMIRAGARYAVVVKVRKAAIQVTINGRQLAAMPVDFSKLRVGPWHRNRQPGNLAIFCDDPTAFYQVEVEEITGEGTLTRPASRQ